MQLEPYYLRFSNGLLILSIVFYYLYSDKNQYETILAFSLVCILVISQLFWNDPKRHSLIHKLDGLIVKIVTTLFIIYTLFYKGLGDVELATYVIVLFCASMLFLISDKHSSQEWCSQKHLRIHILFHITAFIGTLYAFMPAKN